MAPNKVITLAAAMRRVDNAGIDHDSIALVWLDVLKHRIDEVRTAANDWPDGKSFTRFAQADHAAAKAARVNGQQPPEQPFLRKLQEGTKTMTNTKTTTKRSGNGSGKVRAADDQVAKWVAEAILAGHTKHGAIVKFVRGKGHSASQERMRIAMNELERGKAPAGVDAAKVKAALKAGPKPEGPKPTKATPTKQTAKQKAAAATKQVQPIAKAGAASARRKAAAKPAKRAGRRAA